MPVTWLGAKGLSQLVLIDRIGGIICIKDEGWANCGRCVTTMLPDESPAAGAGDPFHAGLGRARGKESGRRRGGGSGEGGEWRMERMRLESVRFVCCLDVVGSGGEGGLE